VDYENGGDILVFSDLKDIRAERAVPLVRNEPAVHPRTGRRLVMVHHLPQGGFVPLDARLPDGRAHPHAGTGFGLSVLNGYPADESDAHAHVAPDLHRYLMLLQYRYDGARFTIDRADRLTEDQVLPGWFVFNRGLGPAIPDGEDLLFGLVGGRLDDIARAHRERSRQIGRTEHPHAREPMGECYGSGLSRWRRGADGWRPISFVPVYGAGPDMAFEPSVIRDHDGSLLLTVRGKGSDAPPGEKDAGGLENTFEHFRVYRSADNGRDWQSVIHLPNMRAPTPVTLNRSAAGTVFLAANPYREQMFDAQGRKILKTKMRDRLCFWPLTPDRKGVAASLCVLDTNARFGPPQSGHASSLGRLDHTNIWSADHPITGVFRLGDGRLHTLISFRLTDAAVTAGGALPAAQAGTWVQEIIDAKEEA
jgi:hypothetical protein